MNKQLPHDTARGLKHWESIKARAKDKDTELFKLFVGKSKPYTFKRINEIAVKMIAELEEIKTYQHDTPSP